MTRHHASISLTGVFLTVWLAGLVLNAPAQDAGMDGPDKLDIPIQKQQREAYLKYKMARMAIQEGDMKLAHRFLHEALAANPENSALRYECARFLAEQGKGKKALETLKLFQGSLELTAKVEYLKAKLKVAEELDGHYVEIEKIQQNKGEQPKKMRADGLLIIELGQIRWGQKINSKVVTQRYSFPVHKLRSGEPSYQFKLQWEGIDDQGVSYRPDNKNAELQVTKTRVGWALRLSVGDIKGGTGIIVFSPQQASKERAK